MKKDPLIISGDWSNFITLPGEQLLLVRRHHWIGLLQDLVVVGFFGFASVLFISGLSLLILNNPLLWVTGLITVVLMISLAAIKHIERWYFHLYVVTNRKLLEVSFSPLSSYVFNDVLLDQVKCTEIDIGMHGLIAELLDVGAISITFDRPTHQEEFILHHVYRPRLIAGILTDMILGGRKQDQTVLWVRNKKHPRKFMLLEDIKQQGTFN